MDLKIEVEYRLAKWIFANLYHEGRVDEKIYHQLLNRLLDECNPLMKSIEESILVMCQEIFEKDFDGFF